MCLLCLNIEKHLHNNITSSSASKTRFKATCSNRRTNAHRHWVCFCYCVSARCVKFWLPLEFCVSNSVSFRRRNWVCSNLWFNIFHRMPAFASSASTGGFSPQWSAASEKLNCEDSNGLTNSNNQPHQPPPSYTMLSNSQSHQPHVLHGPTGLQVSLDMSNNRRHHQGGYDPNIPPFATPDVMCRRQKSYYLLLTLFILGIIVLVFIVVSSAIIYITRKFIIFFNFLLLFRHLQMKHLLDECLCNDCLVTSNLFTALFRIWKEQNNYYFSVVLCYNWSSLIHLCRNFFVSVTHRFR